MYVCVSVFMSLCCVFRVSIISLVVSLVRYVVMYVFRYLCSYFAVFV